MIRLLIQSICFRLVHGRPPPAPIQIETLYLKPGDRVVLKFKGHMTAEQRLQTIEMLEHRLPQGVQALVLDKSVDISVISTAAA